MGDQKTEIDWEAIEPLYCAGIRSLRAIAAEYGCSEGAIRKQAKARGWGRDLAPRIAARADELVRKQAVRNEVRSSSAYQETERDTVEANARMQADIILAHRVDVPRKRELAEKLFRELEDQMDSRGLVEQLTLALDSGDQGKLAEAARRVAALPAWSKCYAELIGAYKTAIGLERQVFGIDNGASGEEEVVGKIVLKMI